MVKRTIFGEEIAENYECWYETKEGKLFDNLEKQLILRLIRPKNGESLLDIGCGTGHFLRWFKNSGLRISGVDNSADMLNIAKKDLNEETELKLANAEKLPYPENKFDIVTMITTLEFLDKPEVSLKEAIRVAKKRVFLGFLNKYSLLSLKRRIKGFFKDSIYNEAKFYSIRKLIRLTRSIDKELEIIWESVGGRFESKNPFGPFIGLLIKIKDEEDILSPV